MQLLTILFFFGVDQLYLWRMASSSYQLKGTAKQPARSMLSQWMLRTYRDLAAHILES